MTSAKFSDFLTPSPLVNVTNQLILFLSSAHWGPHLPPPPADVIYGSPLSTDFVSIDWPSSECY